MPELSSLGYTNTDGSISINGANAVSGAGKAVTIGGGEGDDGGNVSIGAGGGLTGEGGGVQVTGGTGDTAGGLAIINGGQSSNGPGGDVIIYGGQGVGAVYAHVSLLHLPTSDPLVANALYTNGALGAGTPRALMVSGG